MQILIVEDEAISLKNLTMYVHSMGYNTLVAADGREAMTLWRQHHPQIVLTDWNRSEMDGIELCTRIRGVSIFGTKRC